MGVNKSHHGQGYEESSSSVEVKKPSGSFDTQYLELSVW